MMLNHTVQMKTAYPEMISGNGIFNDLDNFDVPWKESVQAQFLDMLYFNRSADKSVTPMLKSMSYDSTLNVYGALSNANRASVANMVATLFLNKWVRLWDVFTIEYNPIDNYDLSENEIINRDIGVIGSNTGTVTNRGTDTHVYTGTDTFTHTGTDATAHTGTIGVSGSNGVDTGLYGFNSTESVPSNTSDTTSSNTQTNNNTDTETKNLTDTETQNLTDADTKNLTETINSNDSTATNDDIMRSLTRKGNIGVTTTQQMLESEIELWNWNYYNMVMQDIDSILCLDIYTH